MRSIEELKELNKEFGMSNDYLEGKKPYEKMTPLEQTDYDKYFSKGEKKNV